MGIVFRQSAKNAFVAVAGASLGALILWLSTKYIANKHQFGFSQELQVWSVTSAQVFLFGFTSTLAVYIHKYSNNEQKRKLLITLCLLIPTIFLAFLTIFYFLFSNRIINIFKTEDIPLLHQNFAWLPLYTLFFIYQMLMEQYLASQMKVAIAAFMREILMRVINIILLLLFAFNYIGFDFYIAGTVLMYLILVAVLFLLSSKTKGFGFTLELSSFSPSEYREMIRFSWYHFLLTVSIMFLGYMDVILLPVYDHNGLAAVAIYRFAQFLIVVLQMPSKALIPASFTVLARAFNDNDMDKAKDIFTRSSINILIPTVCIAVLLFCNLNNVVAVVKNNYAAMIPVFSILFIGSIINIGTGMNDQVLSIANYYKFNFYLSLSLIVVLYFLLRILIPRYGIYGAAWANTTTLMLFNIMKFIFIRNKVNMSPFTSGTLLVVLAALPALAAGYFFPYFFEPARHIYVHTFLDVIMRSTVIVVVYVLMLVWLKPSEDLQEYLASIKKNKRLF